MITEILALAALRRHGTLALSGAYLHLEPSTIWKRIKNLERETGLTLIRKRGRRAELTAEALELLDEVSDPLRAVADTVERLSRGSQSRIRLRVGVAESLMLSWAPELFRAATKKHEAEIDLIFTSHLGPILQEKLKNGSLDLVLSAGRDRVDPSVLDHKLTEEKVFLSSDPHAEIKSLADVTMLFCIGRNSLSYDTLEDQLRKALKREAFSGELRELESYAGIASLVRSGYGAGFVPQGVAELYGLKIHRAVYVTRPISLHYKKGLLRIPEAEALIQRISKRV